MAFAIITTLPSAHVTTYRHFHGQRSARPPVADGEVQANPRFLRSGQFLQLGAYKIGNRVNPSDCCGNQYRYEPDGSSAQRGAAGDVGPIIFDLRHLWYRQQAEMMRIAGGFDRDAYRFDAVVLCPATRGRLRRAGPCPGPSIMMADVGGETIGIERCAELVIRIP